MKTSPAILTYNLVAKGLRKVQERKQSDGFYCIARSFTEMTSFFLCKCMYFFKEEDIRVKSSPSIATSRYFKLKENQEIAMLFKNKE